MPWSGGVYTLPPGTTATTLTAISSSDYNSFVNDVEASFNDIVDGTVTWTAAVKATDGTVSAPGLSFGSDTNTGIYRIGADNMGITVGGVKLIDMASAAVSITGTLGVSGVLSASSSIELGHASDTTLSRSAAGVLAVEGNLVPSPASQATGDILYRGASSWSRLAAGTDGQYLKLASGVPSWASLTAGMTNLGTKSTASGASPWTLSGLTLTNYSVLVIAINGFSTNNGSFTISFNGFQIAASAAASADTVTGIIVVELSTGVFMSNCRLSSVASTAQSFPQAGASGLSTASTSVSLTGTGTGDAGSFTVLAI